MKNRLEPELKTYIHRNETEKAFEELIADKEQLIVIDINGPHWIGKTTVLHHFAKLVKGRKQTAVTYLDMERYVLPGNELYASKDKLEERRRELLEEMVFELFDIDSRQFGDLIRAEQISDRRKDSTTGGISGAVNLVFITFGMNLQTPTAKQLSRDATECAVDVLVGKIKLESAKGTTFTIFMDNFCQIQQTDLEKWILKTLVPALPTCKFILGRSECEAELPVFERVKPRTITIKEFSEKETGMYLTSLFGEITNAQGWAKEICGHSRGNPMLTAWIAANLRRDQLNQPVDPNFLGGILGEISGEPEKLSKLISYMFRDDPEMIQIINAACILRTFNKSLLEKAVAKKVSDAHIPDLIRKLKKLPGISTEKDKGFDEELISINTVLANTHEKQLLQEEAALVDQIHQIAAEYYRQNTQDAMDLSDAKIWERMHNFENRQFQLFNRRWFYHASAMRNPIDFQIESALRYFDAFFWWGDYLPFSFCNHLLTDLKAQKFGDGSHKKTMHLWVDTLAQFHQTFRPKRLRGLPANPNSPQANPWTVEVGHMIQKILSATMPGDPEDFEPRHYHLKGILISYLAEMEWVESAGHKDHPAFKPAGGHFLEATSLLSAAEKYYQTKKRAVELSEKRERKILDNSATRETWFRAWMWVWFTNLLAEHGEDQKALELSARAKKEVLEADETDVEALARIDCARALAFFHQHDWPQALQEFKQYSWHSTAFLVGDYREGGDPYAVEFFREMIEVTGSHLLELQKKQAHIAQQWWSELYDFWKNGPVNLLAAEIPAEFPAQLEAVLVLEPSARVAAHHLPLPYLPVKIDAGEGTIEYPEFLPEEFGVFKKFLEEKSGK